MESVRLFGKWRCMYDDCSNWFPLECHHIKPHWLKGESVFQNGIVLCPGHHAKADSGQITIEELLDIKNRAQTTAIQLHLPGSEPECEVEEIISRLHAKTATLPVPTQELMRFSSCLNQLERSHPASVPSQIECLRAEAHAMQKLAGLYTAWEAPLSGGVERTNDRFYADRAIRLAHFLRKHNPQYCRDISVESWHVFAVSANSRRDRFEALRNAALIYDEAPWNGRYHSDDMAYLESNLAVFFGKMGKFDAAKELLDSSVLPDEEGKSPWLAESRNRYGQVALMKGDLMEADNYIALASTGICSSPVADIILDKSRALIDCLSGRLQDGIRRYQDVLTLSINRDIGDQASKIDFCIWFYDRYLPSRKIGTSELLRTIRYSTNLGGEEVDYFLRTIE